MHAERLRVQVEQVVAQHQRRLDAHAEAAAEGLTGWAKFVRGEEIHHGREPAARVEVGSV